MKTSRRKSAQREVIYKAIKSSSAHPTAAELYAGLKKHIPSLSLGNLYRNIKILIEEGRIKASEFRDGFEHYDAVTAPHYHFVCDCCGKISDLDIPVQEHVLEYAKKKTGIKLTGYTIQYFGICGKCLKKSKKLKEKDK